MLVTFATAFHKALHRARCCASSPFARPHAGHGADPSPLLNVVAHAPHHERKTAVPKAGAHLDNDASVRVTA